MDNIFVIAMIFGFFAIPRKYQHRVLFWGILGVILLRGVMIGFGAKLVADYAWVLYVFAAFLIFTGLKMLWWSESEPDLAKNPLLSFMKRRFNVTDRLHGERFFVRQQDGKGGTALFLTPLFLALVLIEIADVIFAVDSVPAIFAITTDPYIVYTSNIFAILGLRALYFALAAVLHRFAYLKQALAVLLIFIGSKVFVADMLGWAKIPAQWSLGITFAILAAGIAYSLWRTQGGDRSQARLKPLAQGESGTAGRQLRPCQSVRLACRSCRCAGRWRCSRFCWNSLAWRRRRCGRSRRCGASASRPPPNRSPRRLRHFRCSLPSLPSVQCDRTVGDSRLCLYEPIQPIIVDIRHGRLQKKRPRRGRFSRG